MTRYKLTHPEVYIQEISNTRSIVGVPTAFTAFVGLTEKGPLNKATRINSLSQFENFFGRLSRYHNLGYAVSLFFLNGGQDAIIVSVGNEKTTNKDKIIGSQKTKSGIYSLDYMTDFNILCIPPYDESDTTSITVYEKALEYCKKRRAILLVDPPNDWKDAKIAKNNQSYLFSDENAAIYFPRVKIQEKSDFVPCGIIAGIMAKTDYSRGVWKAPAGVEASISGIDDFVIHLTDDEIGVLNLMGINCLKKVQSLGFLVWGSRTMKGNERLASQWKYLPTRRTALFIEESLYRGLKWVVFEPNGEPLWSSIRNTVDPFLNNLFRQGAFQGATTKEAYFIKCDQSTHTVNDIAAGIINLEVGFAPLKPAEFVIIKIQILSNTKSTTRP